LTGLGYVPAYVEEPAEHDVLLARIARGEGMILLPASFSAIQRQGWYFIRWRGLACVCRWD
jgi:hypothetical protein